MVLDPRSENRRQLLIDQLEGTTDSSNRPVHSSPGLKEIGFSIAAASTQSICLYSSSPKSTIAFAFFSHGFHTTVQKSTLQFFELEISLVILYLIMEDLYEDATQN